MATARRVQILSTPLLKLLKRQLKTLEHLSTQLEQFKTAAPITQRLYQDIVAARVSARAAIRDQESP